MHDEGADRKAGEKGGERCVCDVTGRNLQRLLGRVRGRDESGRFELWTPQLPGLR